MQAPDNFAIETGTALAGFNLGRVLDVVNQTAVVVGATSGDLHVEPDHLVAFYNELSALHGKLVAKMETLHSQAVSSHEQQAGGLLPGAKDAWQAMTMAAGALKHADSLYGNMKSVDNQVLTYMGNIKASLESYVANEGQAVVGFGKAAGGGAPKGAHGPVSPARTTSNAVSAGLQ